MYIYYYRMHYPYRLWGQKVEDPCNEKYKNQNIKQGVLKYLKGLLLRKILTYPVHVMYFPFIRSCLWRVIYLSKYFSYEIVFIPAFWILICITLQNQRSSTQSKSFGVLSVLSFMKTWNLKSIQFEWPFYKYVLLLDIVFHA